MVSRERTGVGDVRQAAHANDWTHETVRVVARILCGAVRLTREEAEWLASAGPAWTELESP